MFESLTLSQVAKPGRVQTLISGLLSFRCTPFFWAWNIQRRSHCLLVSKAVNDIWLHYSGNPNKNIIMSSFKSSEDIQKKEGGTDSCFG